MSERPRQPHENLISTSRATIHRALELLPQPDSLTDEQLEYLEAVVGDMMSVLVEIGETAKRERSKRKKNK